MQTSEQGKEVKQCRFEAMKGFNTLKKESDRFNIVCCSSVFLCALIYQMWSRTESEPLCGFNGSPPANRVVSSLHHHHHLHYHHPKLLQSALLSSQTLESRFYFCDVSPPFSIFPSLQAEHLPNPNVDSLPGVDIRRDSSQAAGEANGSGCRYCIRLSCT